MRLDQGKKRLLYILAGIICLAIWNSAMEAGKKYSLRRLPPSTVAVIQSEKERSGGIAEREIAAMVRKSVEMAGGFAGLIKDRQTVVIKPNLVQMNDYLDGSELPPEANGVTADWRVVKALVALVREYNPRGKVYVMECSSIGTEGVMKALKYTPRFIPGVDAFVAIEKDSGAWNDKKRLVRVKLPQGMIRKEYMLNKRYKRADVLISVPCLKTHWSAVITGAVKNVGMGAIPINTYPRAGIDHGSDELHRWIHDFYLCRPVDFVVMDGLVGIQNGPAPIAGPEVNDPKTGPPKKAADSQMNMRLILAGKDAVAVDAIAALVMGWDPGSVNHLRYLNADGAGNLDTARITVVGKPVDAVRKYFAGRIPRAGGRKIPACRPPGIVSLRYNKSRGRLEIHLEAKAPIYKAEVYMDGKICRITAPLKKSRISWRIAGLSPGKHHAAVRIYDRYLNCSERKLNLI
ncbi:MAG: DUF362 domain-containing protein [Bacillota bacterium]